jgi:hypothetical protein
LCDQGPSQNFQEEHRNQDQRQKTPGTARIAGGFAEGTTASGNRLGSEGPQGSSISQTFMGIRGLAREFARLIVGFSKVSAGLGLEGAASPACWRRVAEGGLVSLGVSAVGPGPGCGAGGGGIRTKSRCLNLRGPGGNCLAARRHQ